MTGSSRFARALARRLTAVGCDGRSATNSGIELLAEMHGLRRLVVEEEQADGMSGSVGSLAAVHDDLLRLSQMWRASR